MRRVCPGAEAADGAEGDAGGVEAAYAHAFSAASVQGSADVLRLGAQGELKKGLSPELKKRMQGKTCFNFKTVPEAALLKELKALTKAGMKAFKEKGWA